MKDERAARGPSSAHITDLVSTALRQEKLGGLCEMLRSIAQSCKADACLLWRLAPGSDLTAQPPEGRLFVLAHQWLKDDRLWASHSLGLNSVTGDGIIARRPDCVPDVLNHPRVDATDRFFERTGARTFCTIPISFMDGQKGAVNVYRNVLKPFNDHEVSRVKGLAVLGAVALQTIRNKVGSAKESMRGVVQTICERDHLPLKSLTPRSS